VLLKVLFSGLPLVVHVWTPFSLVGFLFATHSCCVEVVVDELQLLVS